MSTELIKTEQYSVNIFDPKTFETAQRICTLFASSDLVPDQYRIKDEATKAKAIANCLIAINMANRIGADPLMVMQNLYIVHGKPAWSSKFLISTINSCGRFESLKFETFTEGETSYKTGNQEIKIPNLCCVAYTNAKGSKDILKGTKVSIKMAIEEGWYIKNGSKWKTIPDQMLKYRAASFWCSVYAPELSMGIRTQDEVIDIGYEEVPAAPSSPTKPIIPTDANSQELKIKVDEETGELVQQEETPKEQPKDKETEPKQSPSPTNAVNNGPQPLFNEQPAFS